MVHVFWGCTSCGRVLSGEDWFHPQEARVHRCRKMPDGTPDGMVRLVPMEARPSERNEMKPQPVAAAGAKR